MKILFLCHRVPYPPDKGEKIRAFYQLRAMAERHEVDVFTLADDPRDLAHRDALQAHCRRLTIARVHPRLARLRSLPWLVTRMPLTVPYFHSSTLAKAIDQAVRTGEYDRIFVYCSAMAQYVPKADVLQRLGKPLPVVMDMVDVDSDKWAQYANATRFPYAAVYAREARTLRAFERRACDASAVVLVTTPREAELARQLAPLADVRVLPIGVNTAHFATARRPEDDARTVVFTGDMGYFPNSDAARFFAHDVLPLVRRDVPDARFVVVGRNPGPDVLALRQVEGVEVTGYVPDVRPWLAKASIGVAPLKIAAGVQNKILEAMASGLPVVATSKTVQGLADPVRAAVHVGDTPEDLARSVVRLLRDGALRHREGIEAQRLVAEHYSWDRTLAQLLQLVEDPHSGKPAEPAAAGAARPALASTH